MTEQQRKEIAELKTRAEWETYVRSNKLDMGARLRDPELGNAIHTKNFELLDKELRVAVVSDEVKERIAKKRKEKFDPNAKGFRQLVIESRQNGGN